MMPPLMMPPTLMNGLGRPSRTCRVRTSTRPHGRLTRPARFTCRLSDRRRTPRDPAHHHLAKRREFRYFSIWGCSNPDSKLIRRGFQMIRSTLAAGFALALIAAPVTAQCDTDNEYMAVVRVQAIAAGEILRRRRVFTRRCALRQPERGRHPGVTTRALLPVVRWPMWPCVTRIATTIDLRLYDSRGNEVASDIEPDDYPIVRVGTRVSAGRHEDRGWDVQLFGRTMLLRDCNVLEGRAGRGGRYSAGAAFGTFAVGGASGHQFPPPLPAGSLKRAHTCVGLRAAPCEVACATSQSTVLARLGLHPV